MLKHNFPLTNIGQRVHKLLRRQQRRTLVRRPVGKRVAVTKRRFVQQILRRAQKPITVGLRLRQSAGVQNARRRRLLLGALSTRRTVQESGLEPFPIGMEYTGTGTTKLPGRQANASVARGVTNWRHRLAGTLTVLLRTYRPDCCCDPGPATGVVHWNRHHCRRPPCLTAPTVGVVDWPGPDAVRYLTTHCCQPVLRRSGRWASCPSASWCTFGKSCRTAREPWKFVFQGVSFDVWVVLALVHLYACHYDTCNWYSKHMLVPAHQQFKITFSTLILCL